MLASASPRRRELLAALGLDFEVVPADIDETPRAGESADALVGRLSRGKAAAVAQLRPEVRAGRALVIAADTVVVLDGEVLGKPHDRVEARSFIGRLAGRSHRVLTGHALRLGEREVCRVRRTEVTFRTLDDGELDRYAASGEGLDKAGGYAIQGLGSALVERIDGCYFNVVGLSVPTVVQLARRLGAPLV